VGVWSYLEVQMKCDGSTGTCVIRLDGVEVKNLTGLDTLYTSATLTRFALGCRASSDVQLDLDDLVVMDLNGSFNNTLLGDATVTATYPSGAGTTTGWTPSTGANYACVDEAVLNDDTDYISTSTVNAKDTYAFGDAPAGADIRAVQILIAVRKGQEGPGKIKPVVRSASTDYLQTEQSISGTTYAFMRTLLEADPATSSPWSESGFNAAEFGMVKTG
jgi:hypothetical protein